MAAQNRHATWALSYRERAALPSSGPLAAYLLRLMSIKQTNLCLSADVLTSKELLELAETLGDEICILKTHCDIITDWTDATARALRDIARRKWFVIFEDRKFADIGGMSVQSSLASALAAISSSRAVTLRRVGKP
jgi:uridine monophosphate synthetase